MTPWSISISQFEGLAPAYWEDTYPLIGNKGHASSLTAVDLTNPNVMTQGPGLSALTNGTESVVTTSLKGIQQISLDGTNIYGVGGNLLHKITASAITNDGTFPHTIDKGAVTGETGEDVCEYQGYTFYSYDYTTAGDVGRLSGASTFDDDYMSTVPTGAAALTGGVPHKMFVGGDDTLYILNGAKIATLRTTTFTAADLDLPVGEVAVDGGYTGNRVWIATNRPNISASVQAESSVYVWDGTSDSWEYQIKVYGKIGALHIKNGIVYIWYQDTSYSGGYKLGIVSGTGIKDLLFYDGGLPSFHQITEYKNHILWVAGQNVWAYGATTGDLPVRLFKLASLTYATGGGITNALATPIVSSTNGTNIQVAKFSGHSVASTWSSIAFDVANSTQKSHIAKIVIFTEPLSTGAKLDGTMSVNFGAVTKTLDQLAYAAGDPNKTRHILLNDSIEVENFRIDLNWANGSTTNPVKIRKIIIDGYYSENQ